MKKLFFTLAALVPAIGVPAKPVPADEIAALVPAAEIVSGTFTQTKNLLDLEITLDSSGEFVFSKNHGALWQTLVPAKSAVFIGEDALVFFDKDNKKTQEIKISASELAREISQIVKDAMLGNIAALKKIFKISADKENDAWTLELTPEQSGLPFKKILIGGNAGQIESVRFLNDGEDEETLILLKSVRTGDRGALKKIDALPR